MNCSVCNKLRKLKKLKYDILKKKKTVSLSFAHSKCGHEYKKIFKEEDQLWY